jgi:8-oxo-dGTP pyrophosphatase MutT (NUDIX family)
VTSVPRTVEAAGCVVWRRSGGTADGPIEVLLVHRPPPHDDWSLPKGKLDAGERHAVAAVREVHEETGVRGDLGPKLGEVRYELANGDHKHVQFWAMHADLQEDREPDDEVDALRWLPVAAAAAELTWSSDRGILASFTARFADDG